MTLPTRLKTTQVSAARAALAVKQGQRCAVCNLPMHPTSQVLDHDHTTGAVRATLHRGCNSLLGKVENNYKRYGVADVFAFANGVAAYMQRHGTNQTGWLHPTHKTEDEARLLRNTRARKARATKKAPS